MLIPKLVGTLGVLSLAAALALAIADAKRIARWLVAGSVVLVALGSGLAIETEARYHSCVQSLPAIQPVGPGMKTCSRWPW